MFSTVIWDWNGTLLDDVDACVETGNAMLEARGMPALDTARYREIFTFPVIDYYRRAGFTFESETFEDVAAQYTSWYMERSRECRLFRDAIQALETLRGAGLTQILLTASHEDMLLAQLKAFDISRYFEAMVARKDALARGKAESARRLIRERGIDPRQTALIGDTEHDHDVADALGAACALVPRGHHGRGRLESRLNAPGRVVIADNLIEAAGWVIGNRGAS
ncbi:MAG: HAD hydrolase-like protein [Oscillospiraceae bacterium]|jgi:phosphoglycolate phosphatase|nr:HAD hydrolase-like protein [Oscillospiraceae bacterium]